MQDNNESMRNELDEAISELEDKFEDFVESLHSFGTKARKYLASEEANSSDMWVYHLDNILNEMDDMVTELATFGEENNLF